MEPKRTYVGGYWGEGVAPHTATQRLGITNNTEKVYRVVHLFLFYERASEATTPGVVDMRVELTVSGESGVAICLERYTGNTVYQRGSYTLPNQIMLWKGDTLRVYTSDSSTGGTMNYMIGVVYEVI